jgi:hypothetical protein
MRYSLSHLTAFLILCSSVMDAQEPQAMVSGNLRQIERAVAPRPRRGNTRCRRCAQVALEQEPTVSTDIVAKRYGIS